jgi:hypothetical protein
MEIKKGYTNKITHKSLMSKFVSFPFFCFGIGFRGLNFVTQKMRLQDTFWKIKIV